MINSVSVRLLAAVSCGLIELVTTHFAASASAVTLSPAARDGSFPFLPSLAGVALIIASAARPLSHACTSLSPANTLLHVINNALTLHHPVGPLGQIIPAFTWFKHLNCTNTNTKLIYNVEENHFTSHLFLYLT